MEEIKFKEKVKITQIEFNQYKDCCTSTYAEIDDEISNDLETEYIGFETVKDYGIRLIDTNNQYHNIPIYIIIMVTIILKLK